MDKGLREAITSINTAIANLRTDMIARVTKLEDRLIEMQRTTCTCGVNKDTSSSRLEGGQ